MENWRKQISDKTRSGRPVTAIDQLHQHRVEELISENRRTIQKEIAVALGIFKDRGEHIIGVLGFRKSLCQMGYRARQR